MFNGFEILMVSKCDFFGVGNNPRGGILSSPVEKIMREAKKCSSTTKDRVHTGPGNREKVGDFEQAFSRP